MTPIHDLFEQFNRLSVLILGDVMIDRYLTGRVERISPEAPVPVVRFEHQEDRLGGAANVALNVKALGAQAYLCSVIGQDENAQKFLRLLPEENLPDDGLVLSKTRQTTVKTRVIADQQHLLRVDREDQHLLSAEEEQHLFNKVIKLLDDQKIDIILFQDYNKGVLTPTLIKQVLAESKKREIPTAVDPKKDQFFDYKGVTLFKPNLKEVREGTALPVDPTYKDLRKASDFLRSKLNHTYSLITLSEKGLYIDTERDGQIVPTRARNIADVCGAGDTVISLAALGVALNMDLQQLAVLANLAGGQVCEKVGVVPVDKCQLIAEYDHFHRFE